jgi:hypothetical protein
MIFARNFSIALLFYVFVDGVIQANFFHFRDLSRQDLIWEKKTLSFLDPHWLRTITQQVEK